MIWLVFALLTGAAVMSVLWPLARGRAGAAAADADVAFFKAQIAEIARETQEGRLDPHEAEAARAEAARRLLRAESARGAAPSASRKAALIAALAAILLIPGGALALYAWLGSALPDMPLAARLEAAPDHNDLAGAVARIELHLRDHPQDGRGFEVVAPYYLRTGRLDDAVNAYAQALRLLGPTAQRHAALGEAQVMEAQGTVAEAARKNFEAALALDAAQPMARYYIGLAAAQDGDKAKAESVWGKLVAEAPADAPYVALIEARLKQLRGEEVPPAVAAAPEGGQMEMIRSMVARLAARLAEQGGGAEEWMKLIRAYSVLAEPEKAQKALADARKALAEKSDDRAKVEALAKELNIGG